ncbi:tRNAHis guanylyltransferase-domain-containing protein [Mycena olivaceomarginata]|nr:tRNAHis guanylyltransferase-domain-containing protein [Mycena olivaceomarginata]
MAGSKYAYVRNFELHGPLLPGVFMVFRWMATHSIGAFSEEHEFTRPSDIRALALMDHTARDLMEQYFDIVFAFGESDEFNFLIRKPAALCNHRQSKILSTLTSVFTSTHHRYDGRLVLYSSVREVRDYFSWRQTDTHINNQYNTASWDLSTTQAHATLKGTVSRQKRGILFSRFQGSTLIQEEISEDPSLSDNEAPRPTKPSIDDFWDTRSDILSD